MEQVGKRIGNKIVESCPTCGVPRNDWPFEGVTRQGTLYCCSGCADGTGCICHEKSRKLASKDDPFGRGKFVPSEGEEL